MLPATVQRESDNSRKIPQGLLERPGNGSVATGVVALPDLVNQHLGDCFRRPRALARPAVQKLASLLQADPEPHHQHTLGPLYSNRGATVRRTDLRNSW